MEDRDPLPEPDPVGDPLPEPVPVPGEPDAAEPGEAATTYGRRYPSTLGGMIYLGVLLATGVGIAITATGNWRMGTLWMAGALLVAGVARLVLPQRDAGMLAVRHRSVDFVLLAGVGAILIFLATTIPNQPR